MNTSHINTEWVEEIAERQERRMSKPAHPSSFGVVEPKKFIQETKFIYLDQLDGQKIKLETIIALWNKAVKDIEDYGNGIKIVNGPYISTPVYGNAKIEYRVEYENLNFEVQKQEYGLKMKQYHEALALYEEHQSKHKKVQEELSLDEKIKRAEERLANLKAVKEGKEISFK